MNVVSSTLSIIISLGFVLFSNLLFANEPASSCNEVGRHYVCKLYVTCTYTISLSEEDIASLENRLARILLDIPAETRARLVAELEANSFEVVVDENGDLNRGSGPADTYNPIIAFNDEEAVNEAYAKAVAGQNIINHCPSQPTQISGYAIGVGTGPVIEGGSADSDLFHVDYYFPEEIKLTSVVPTVTCDRKSDVANVRNQVGGLALKLDFYTGPRQPINLNKVRGRH